MSEHFTLEFHRAQGRYELMRTVLKTEAGEAICESDVNRKASRVFPSDGNSNVLIFALAFVRIAQSVHTSSTELLPKRMGLFRNTPDSQTVNRFANIYRDGARRADEARRCKWVQLMLWCDGEPENGEPWAKRLDAWFHVHTSPPLVSWKTEGLPKESVKICIDGEEANFQELDELDDYLSHATLTGVAPFLEQKEVRVMGRWPSIQPNWVGREKECAELDEIYAANTAGIIEICAASGTGKTVLASRWLRRKISTGGIKHKLVFAWRYPRQGMINYVRTPSIAFFSELALALDVSFPDETDVRAKAAIILDKLQYTAAIFFFDGLEAAVSQPANGGAPKNERGNQLEIDSGIAELVRGISEGRGGKSIVLMTTTKDLAEPFAVVPGKLQRMSLKQLPWDELSEAYTGLKNDVDVIPKLKEDETRSALLAGLQESVWRARPENMNRDEFDNWKTSQGALLPPSEYARPVPVDVLSNSERSEFNIYLRNLDGKPMQILFYLIVCHDEIAEDDLLTVAASRDWQMPADTTPKMTKEAWEEVLDDLLAHRMLEQPARASSYTLHPKKRRYVLEGLRLNLPVIWRELNRALADLYAIKSPGRAQTRAECMALLDAAVHLCQAGESQLAYDDICFERLGHKMKAYVITVMGEYEAPKGVIDALLTRHEGAAISTLSREAETMCVHVSGLCSRYLDDLEMALKAERDAWVRAKIIGTSVMMAPVGVALIRLCHIFGYLRESKEVEMRLFLGTIWDTLRGRKPDFPEENMVDGASFISTMLALSTLYRGASAFRVKLVLDKGIGMCRDHGAEFKYLMPSFGRPWQALVLLELGEWRLCEQALTDTARNEWTTELVRYKQTGFFEILAAKTYLGKAKSMSGSVRKEAIQKACYWSEMANEVIRQDKYRWWITFANLTLGEVRRLQKENAAAQNLFQEAIAMSQKNGFGLLEVDSRLALAGNLLDEGDQSASEEQLMIAKRLAEQLQYQLRKKEMKQLEALLRKRRS